MERENLEEIDMKHEQHEKHQVPTDRRNFLKLAGLGTVGTVATAASTVVATAAELAPEPTNGGYRETEHVKRVYELSRF